MATQIELLRSAHWAPVRRAPGPLARSMWVWLGVVAYLAVVELFITLVGAGLEHDPRNVLFSWPSLAIFGSAGLVGIWSSQRTGFPSAWDAHRGRERLVYPTALGLGFGLLAAVLDQRTHGIPFFLEHTGLAQFNAPFPGSLLFYPGGAILVEVLYRLLPIPLLLWLISSVLLRGRAQPQVFWTLAVLSSAIEPLSQDLLALRAGATHAVRLSVRLRLRLQPSSGRDVPPRRLPGRHRHAGRHVPGMARCLWQLHLRLLTRLVRAR
jgi:hypothetical protein